MKSNMQSSVRKLTIMAILSAIALIIFIIEAQIPIPFPVPGVKLGLANTITLVALFINYHAPLSWDFISRNSSKEKNNDPPVLNNFDVFLILICRIFLGAFFTGRIITFVFSISGGLLAFFAMIIIKRFVNNKQIWVCGVIGAVFHNIGQLSAAIFMTGSPAIIVYLPILIIFGTFTGVITGLVAQFTLLRVRKDMSS